MPVLRVTALQLFLANTKLGTVVSLAALGRWPLITSSGNDPLRGFTTGKIRTELFPCPGLANSHETDGNSFSFSQLERLRVGSQKCGAGLRS